MVSFTKPYVEQAEKMSNSDFKEIIAKLSQSGCENIADKILKNLKMGYV